MSTINNMVQRSDFSLNDNEKVYKVMNNTGITSLVMGIILVIFSIGIGVTMIVGGARLIKNKASIMF